MKTLGFTPLIHSLVKEIGIYGATVYGYIWLNRDSNGIFDQSKPTIAINTGLSRSTVFSWVNNLLEIGYVQDLTPDEIAKPHQMICTGPAIELEMSFKASYPQGTPPVPPRSPADGRGESVQQTPGSPLNRPMHEHDDACIHRGMDLTPLWLNIGLDEIALQKFLQRHNPEPDAFESYLRRWSDAMDDDVVPSEWGPGLIYRKIEAGELPPKKETWFDDDDLALFANMRPNNDEAAT